jgi:hypothetical protein
MSTGRIGTLKPEDRAAVFKSAQRLGVSPYELGAVIHQESGFRPNVYGGAGGNYYGLIQFGGPERAKYLDKNKLGNYTIAEQLPAVENFLIDRGFKPGKMGVDRLYATILGGNPNVNLNAKDSFGTSVASSLPRFKEGGSLYKAAQATLGDPLSQQPAATAAPASTASTAQKNSIDPQALLGMFMGQMLANPNQNLNQRLMSLMSPSASQMDKDLFDAEYYTPVSSFLTQLTGRQ